jgi:biopolymer transport protein ExbD
MRRIRRSDYSPRIELAPVLDVVFVLLTFFVYSVAMMIEADVLPLRLTALAAGATPSAETLGKLDAITIDKDGKLFFNREPVDQAQLDTRLAELKKKVERPRIYLAMEAQGDKDRGPMFIELIGQVQKAGITDFVIVGQKTPAPGSK